jgi:hypothetical protein
MTKVTQNIDCDVTIYKKNVMRVLVESGRQVSESGKGFLVVGLAQNFRTVDEHDRDIIFNSILTPALYIGTNKGKFSFFYRRFTGRTNQYLE